MRDLGFWLFVLGGLAVFLAVGYRRWGSMTGAWVGGRVRQVLGETGVDPSGIAPISHRVQLVDRPGREPLVVVSILNPNSVTHGMIALRLTQTQALELGQILQRAAGF
jgi:hypothetical protein